MVHSIRFAIAPWNAPASLTVRSIAVALFCGNTVVLRGSELTPRIHYLIVKAFHEAGLPDGVLNLISTSSPNTPTLVSEIIAHPQIRHVNVGASIFTSFSLQYVHTPVHWRWSSWENHWNGSSPSIETLCSRAWWKSANSRMPR